MSSIVLGIFSSITNWFVHIFEDIFNFIPKVVYLLNTALFSLIDILQLFFRKLAGLDVYYSTTGKAVKGDLLTNFISGILGIKVPGAENDMTQYSLLSTIFWSFVIFGLILLVTTTVIAIVKSHYAIDGKDVGNPKPILISAGKAILNMIVVPFVVVLGLFLSQAILQALDAITLTNDSTIEQLYGDSLYDKNNNSVLKSVQDESGNKNYSFYDIFGIGGEGDADDMAKTAASYQPFSGTMFKVAAYNANRVRSGYYGTDTAFTGNGGGGLSLFTEAGNDVERMANLVDTAFANFLHLNQGYSVEYNKLRAEIILTTFTTRTIYSFSKYDVGAVWYYYNLWNYNFIVGFGAVFIFLTIFFNITFAMMKRFFMCIVMILIMPAVVGITPLDGGNGFKSWVKSFVGQALMAYGAVVGMNLALVILPYINGIKFFNIPPADLICQTLFIIVGMLVVKDLIKLISSFVGSEDAYSTGKDINGDLMKTAGKATAAAMAVPVSAARAGLKLAGGAAHVVGKGLKSAGQGIIHGISNGVTRTKANKEAKEKTKDSEEKQKLDDANTKLSNYKQDYAGKKELKEQQDNDLKALQAAASGKKVDMNGLSAEAKKMIQSKNLFKKGKIRKGKNFKDVENAYKKARGDKYIDGDIGTLHDYKKQLKKEQKDLKRGYYKSEGFKAARADAVKRIEEEKVAKAAAKAKRKMVKSPEKVAEDVVHSNTFKKFMMDFAGELGGIFKVIPGLLGQEEFSKGWNSIMGKKK